ncbi:MAG TPA: TlpA disulfide reductase family protein [Pyrinomonadaceae bacterium]|nr:TlpA disulfide reductase family protein [Pyrinomonadaceae bacterium]
MKRIATLLITVIFALALHAQDSNANKTPSITLKDLKGKTVKLSDFKGKVILLNFWATWCVPCAAEAPELVKWQELYKNKLQIVGITYPPTNAVKVRRFVNKNKINYPILLGSKSTKKLFEPSDTLPITVIIDGKGKILDRIDGVIFADEFETKIKPLLN